MTRVIINLCLVAIILTGLIYEDQRLQRLNRERHEAAKEIQRKGVAAIVTVRCMEDEAGVYWHCAETKREALK